MVKTIATNIVNKGVISSKKCILVKKPYFHDFLASICFPFKREWGRRLNFFIKKGINGQNFNV